MNFKEKSNSNVNNQRGQGMIEYLIIISLIAVASIAIIRGLQGNLTAQFAKVTNAIGGHKSNSETEQANENDFRKRDMGDFFNNSVAPKNSGGKNGGSGEKSGSLQDEIINGARGTIEDAIRGAVKK